MNNISMRKLNKLFTSIYKIFKGWEVTVEIVKKKDNPELIEKIYIKILWPK